MLKACPATLQTFPLGANGIYAEKTAVWTVNTDKGTLVKVEVEESGAAGLPSAVASDCVTLEGVDGLRLDPRNPTTGFIATNNAKNSIVSISRTGQVVPLISGKPPLYSPADLAHVPETASPSIFLVVNASVAEAFAPPDAGALARPSCPIGLELTVDIVMATEVEKTLAYCARPIDP